MSRFTPRRLALAAEAVGELARARLIVDGHWSRGWRAELERPIAVDPSTRTSESDPAARSDRVLGAARDVAWAVRAAARRVPFEAVCLPQALAARRMLGRRGIDAAVSVGARRASGTELHAWVTVDGVVVLGGGRALDGMVPVLTR